MFWERFKNVLSVTVSCLPRRTISRLPRRLGEVWKKSWKRWLIVDLQNLFLVRIVTKEKKIFLEKVKKKRNNRNSNTVTPPNSRRPK